VETVERFVSRSDAWTAGDDNRLAGLVLRHISTGSTQLRAFEEAANELTRTAAACGYRWNGVVRKYYRDEIEVAKRDRKHSQKTASPTIDIAPGDETVSMNTSDSMKDVIKFLQAFDDQYQKLRHQISNLEADRKQLELKVYSLEAKLNQPYVDANVITPEQLEADSKTLFAIMARARRLIESESSQG